LEWKKIDVDEDLKSLGKFEILNQPGTFEILIANPQVGQFEIKISNP